MRLVLLGAPGSGKGTQADFLKAEYRCAHISTGDILRKNISEKTELGLRAETFMNKGELVPDAVIIDMVEARLGWKDIENGFLMDGFPRTVPQAEVLDEVLRRTNYPLDAALLLDADDEITVKRLTNRRMCRGCGKISSLLTSPGINKCPDCGGELYQRDDDNERVIRNRLQVYKQQTAPLAAWYDGKGLLRSLKVREAHTPEDTYKAVKAALGMLGS